MSFYRSIITTVAALSIAMPIFAQTTAVNPSLLTPAATTPANSPASKEAKLNINKASAKDLMKLKGLNASKARAIVAFRKKQGEFKSLDELASVKGFKKMKPDSIKEIQSQLTVE